VETNPPDAIVWSEPVDLKIINVSSVIEDIFARDYPPLESRLIDVPPENDTSYNLVKRGG